MPFASRSAAPLILLSLFSAATLQAQPVDLPRQSPAASVSQTFAYTTATVRYSRPAVNGRVIWGGLVPYGQVWRAGANEATTIEFATDVRVAGKPLPKGRYGFFILPSATEWILIFNKKPDQWGAFTYDAKDDALRVPVKPVSAAFAERLEYGFDDPTDSSAVLRIRWEKLAASVTVSADFLEHGKTVLREALSKAKPGDPYLWLNAARFYWTNGIDRDQAMAWIDTSIAIQPLYNSLWTKAEWLAERKDYPEAVKTGKRARAEAAKDPGTRSQVPSLDATIARWEKAGK